MANKDRHGWLRGALADAGLRQKDVAEMWSCDEAVISRFIKTGEPQLTFDRALQLSRKLNMSLDELTLRLDEGLAPRKSGRTAALQVSAGRGGHSGGSGTADGAASGNGNHNSSDVAVAIAEAKAAIARLQELLPDAKIIFHIDLGV